MPAPEILVSLRCPLEQHMMSRPAAVNQHSNVVPFHTGAHKEREDEEWPSNSGMRS